MIPLRVGSTVTVLADQRAIRTYDVPLPEGQHMVTAYRGDEILTVVSAGSSEAEAAARAWVME